MVTLLWYCMVTLLWYCMLPYYGTVVVTLLWYCSGYPTMVLYGYPSMVLYGYPTMVLQWLKCPSPGVIGSVQGLVDLSLMCCDWV